jgi:hypothetical protein
MPATTTTTTTSTNHLYGYYKTRTHLYLFAVIDFPQTAMDVNTLMFFIFLFYAFCVKERFNFTQFW